MHPVRTLRLRARAVRTTVERKVVHNFSFRASRQALPVLGRVSSLLAYRPLKSCSPGNKDRTQSQNTESLRSTAPARCRQNHVASVLPRGSIRRMSAFVHTSAICTRHGFRPSSVGRGQSNAAPNPSLNRTGYGRQRKPGLWHMVHHHSPGLRRLPPPAG